MVCNKQQFTYFIFITTAYCEHRQLNICTDLDKQRMFLKSLTNSKTQQNTQSGINEVM